MKVEKTSKNDYTITGCETEREIKQAFENIISELNWKEGEVIDGREVESVRYRYSLTEKDGEYFYMGFLARRFVNPLNNIAVYEHPEHGAIAVK